MKYTNFEHPKTSLNTIQNINHIIGEKKKNISIITPAALLVEPSEKLIRHNPAATSEWDNSVYSYLNRESQISSVIDQSTYDLVRVFFNSRPSISEGSSKSTTFRHRSILKTFIGRPRIKSSLNRTRITIYKYNRQKVYYMNMLKKSFMLWPNKKHNIQSKNNIKGSSKKLVTTVSNPYLDSSLACYKSKANNTNIALPVLNRKKVFLPLVGKKGIRTYSSFSSPEKGIKNTVINVSVRRVPSVAGNTKNMVTTVVSNNLSIVRSEKKNASFFPNLYIARLTMKNIYNPNNIHGINKAEVSIKKLSNSVKRIKMNIKNTKSKSFYTIFPSKNKKSSFFTLKNTMANKKGETNVILDSNKNEIILTGVKKGNKKYIDSKNITILSKLPFNKKIPGKFKRAIKGVRIFTPKDYNINNIRYWYPPVISKSLRVETPTTNSKGINSKKLIQKRGQIKSNLVSSPNLDRKKNSRIMHKNRISRWMQRKMQKKIQKGKKRIFFNILRNNTFQLVLSSLKNSFKSSPSLLVLKKMESHSMKYILKIKSLKLFLFHYANMGTSKCTPGFLFTLWNKLINYTSSYISISNNKIYSGKYGKKANFDDKLILPTLRVGKLVGKYYKRIFASKFYYTILWVYYMKSNNLYLSRLNNILKKRYGKKVTLNIVDLKYLYLDSNIMAEAITTKLKDRKKRVLRVLKRALGLIKKPYFKIHFYNKKKMLEQLNVNFLLMDKKLNLTTYSLSNNIILNKYLFKKPINYKSRLLLFHLKHKIISGVRLEGSGRLTRRLTASRSISKFKYMGSLQNIESSRQALSTVVLRGYMKSNSQYTNINSYNRNGAFGVKVSVSSY